MNNKILYATFDVVPSAKGASVHVSAFIKALAEEFPQTTLFSLKPTSNNSSTYHQARHLGVWLEEDNFLRRALLFRACVREHLEENDYDIVHVRSIWEGLAAVQAKKKGFKLIFEANGFPSIELKYHYPLLKNNPQLLEKIKEQEKVLMEASDLIITPSQVTKNYIVRQGSSQEKVVKISNGVDVNFFKPLKRKNISDVPKIFYSGTLAPWQGIDFLLKVFRKIAKELPVELVIAGSGKKVWLKHYKKMAKEMGVRDRVHFLRPVPHEKMPLLIRKSDVCVAPLLAVDRNLEQGCCPLKIFEYMACGKVIVAPDLPVVTEVLAKDEALLYQADSGEDFYQCLREALLNQLLRDKISLNARKKVVQKYNWQNITNKLIKLYKGIVLV